MSFDFWLAFAAASMVLLLIPGPTVLLVLSYALSKGRSVAIASAAGVAVGDFIAMTASLLGLGALVLAYATAFMVLKWIGAVYLVWLGIKMIRSAPSKGLAPARDVTTNGVFGHAAAVTALNPKSIAFFIAFVPQFIQPQAALLPDRLRRVVGKPNVLAWVTRAGGTTLIGMGLLTATLRRAP